MKRISTLFILLFAASLFAGCGSYETGGDINFDTDGDKITNASDNCPNLANPNQVDIDVDGIGDICDDEIAPVITGTLVVSGTIYDMNGNPIEGAEVTVSSDPVSVMTDAYGNFTATIEIGTGRHNIVVKFNSVELYSEDFDAFDNNPVTLDDISTTYDLFTNSGPLANAGPDQNDVTTGSVVTLDGSGSSDIDGDTITYNWSFESFPDGVAPALPNTNKVNPTFTPIEAGTYVVRLVVNDGTVDSMADTVQIIAEEPVIAFLPPENVSATAGAGMIDVSWDNVAGATSYMMYWSYTSGDGLNGQVIQVAGESYTHEKLIYGQDYYYVVKAVNATGESEISNEATNTPDRKEISSIDFADTNLATCVAGAATGMTYVDEMTSLTCSSRGITIINLDGIGWLTGLDYLYLGKNSIIDIHELSGLMNLQELWLITNSITDVTDLAGLTNLLELYVRSNSISTGIADLVSLVNASTIDIRLNPDIPCSDISTLETELGVSVVVHDNTC